MTRRFQVGDIVSYDSQFFGTTQGLVVRIDRGDCDNGADKLWSYWGRDLGDEETWMPSDEVLLVKGVHAPCPMEVKYV